jgi:carboxymethylenebutenolidase
VAALRAPVLGFFAEKDSFVNATVVGDLAGRLSKAGKKHDFKTYPGAQHAFFNDTRPEVYDAAAAKDSWTKTLAFFRANLS